MIASTVFSLVILLVLINKISFADFTGDANKELSVKPVDNSSPLVVKNQNAVPKILVSIYYGSLCLDCEHLFKNQIEPNLKKFQKYVSFDFVPYGNTEVKVIERRRFFKCEYGLNECLKNKWQACSIQVLLAKVQLLNRYLVCYMNSTDEMHSGYQCTIRLGLNYEYYTKIKKCYMDREFSDSLMAHYGNRTQTAVPRDARMPAIAFNGVYDETEQEDAKNDLVKAVCKHLHPAPVELCS